MKWMKTLAVAAMLLTVSSGAYAQVNLKALKEKAKQEAERMKQEAAAKLKETVDSTVNAAKADVNKKAGEVLGAANEATGGLLDATGATAAVAGAAGLSGIGSFSGSGDFLNSGKTWYVSAEGSNKNDGASAATPLKNLQKAIDSAESGDIILVAEGNYLGTLDVGYIEVKDKFLSLVGGYTADFSQRNPYVHRTTIITGPDHVSKNGAKALMNLDAKGGGIMLVDGFGFDLGGQNKYAAPVDDPRNGWPEGCLTGRMQEIGQGLSCEGGTVGGAAQSHQLMHGNIEGTLVVRNCVFANGCYYGIQMMNIAGDWEIYNNVFVSNVYAACQIDSMNKDANKCSVDFHHNTVLFSWCRTKVQEDMGFGFRFMSRVDASVHDNIFGCNNYGALEYTHKDPNKSIEALRKVSIKNNQFFMNKGDIVLPSASAMWLFVRCDQFEDVEDIDEESGNIELKDAKFAERINQPYLNGFAGLKIMQSSSFDANSAANLYRQAHGLNMQGSEIVRPSMWANRYPFEECYNLFGALAGSGAQ